MHTRLGVWPAPRLSQKNSCNDGVSATLPTRRTGSVGFCSLVQLSSAQKWSRRCTTSLESELAMARHGRIPIQTARRAWSYWQLTKVKEMQVITNVFNTIRIKYRNSKRWSSINTTDYQYLREAFKLYLWNNLIKKIMFFSVFHTGCFFTGPP